MLGVGGVSVGPIGLIAGVSCFLCSSAVPGVLSFLRVTRRKQAVDTSKQVTQKTVVDYYRLRCCLLSIANRLHQRPVSHRQLLCEVTPSRHT